MSTKKTERLAPTLHTIKRLYSLSGNKCAFENCANPLFSDSGVCVGEICHIEAALDGGPRFNKGSNPEERRSFDNLLLLCRSHHKEVDSLDSYTPEKLIDIKRAHESKSDHKQLTLNENQYVELINNYLEQQSSILKSIQDILSKLYLFSKTEEYFSIRQEYLPSIDLFRNKLFFQTEYEKINSTKLIENYTAGTKFGIIEGLPAAGKTTLAISVALNFQSKGISTYYCQITSKTSAKDILQEAYQLRNQATLLIFDDIQNNISLACDVYVAVQEYPSTDVLFISRKISSDFQENENGLNIFNEVDNKIDLSQSDNKDVLERKFEGIISSFKKSHSIQNEVGSINKIINNCNSNLLKLSLTLKEWRDVKEPLDKIDSLSLNKSIYKKYLKGFSILELDILLEGAILFSFGIEFHLINSRNLEEGLERLGLIIEINETQKLFSLGHSDFAELVCDTIIQNDSRFDYNRFKGDEKIKFKGKIIEAYLKRFPVASNIGLKHPKNLLSLFIKLGQERQKKIIDNLLSHESIRHLIISYLNEEKVYNKEIKDFLKVLIYKSKNHLQFFFEKIFDPNDNIALRLGEAGFDLFGYFIALSYSNAIEAPFEHLLLTIDNKTIKQLLIAGRLSSITLSCVIIGRHNRVFALRIIDQLTVEEWVTKFKAEPLFVISDSLTEVRILNQRLAQDIFSTLDKKSLIEKGKSLKLLHLEKALGELKEFDLELCKAILAGYSKNKLHNEIGHFSVSKIGKTLNTLFKINPSEISEIFHGLDSNQLAENLIREPLSDSFRAIEELRNISYEKALSITEILLQKDVSGRIRTSEDLFTLIHSLVNLKYHNVSGFIATLPKKIIGEILEKTTITKFAASLAAITLIDKNLARELFAIKQVDLNKEKNFGAWGQIILKLRTINFDEAKEITDRINLDSTISNICSTSITFQTVSQVLSELHFVNKSISKEILHKLIETEEFKSKIKRENIDSFLDSIRLTDKVDKTKTSIIWNEYKGLSMKQISSQQIDVVKFCAGLNKIHGFGTGIIPGLIDIFWNQLNSKINGIKFNELMHALSDLHNVAPKKAADLLDLCSIDYLKIKALEIPANKLNGAMGELRKIDKQKYDELKIKLKF